MYGGGWSGRLGQTNTLWTSVCFLCMIKVSVGWCMRCTRSESVESCLFFFTQLEETGLFLDSECNRGINYISSKLIWRSKLALYKNILKKIGLFKGSVKSHLSPLYCSGGNLRDRYLKTSANKTQTIYIPLG